MSTEPTRESCADFEPLIPAELVVRDPEICSGRPTMRGTRILAENVHHELAGGMSWIEILEWWPSIPIPASQAHRGATNTPDPSTDRGTGQAEAHGAAQAGDPVDIAARILVGADWDDDEAWGDGERDHIRDWAEGVDNELRTAYYREVAVSLERLGHTAAARAVRSAAKDLEDGDG